jgi:hypothetical protein
MTTAIVKRSIDLPTWKMIQEAAPIMHKSRLFGVATEEQAMAIMAKGFELGLGMTTSFEFIQVIQGKPTLIPRGALALAYQSGEIDKLEITEKNDDKGIPYSCTVTGNRKGGGIYTLTFTMDDAIRAGLVKPGSAWETWKANMLKWRAIGFWLDVVMPDVQGGMKRADEFGAAVDSSGNVIDAVFTASPAIETTPGPGEPPIAIVSMDELITEYGVDKVMDAINQIFDGAMPATNEQMQTLSSFLKVA